MRILSLDGGGYLGLATAAFLQAAERRHGALAADRFDLFCGTSTGAIIALGLAAGRSAAEIAELYERIGPTVFRQSTSPLRKNKVLWLLRAALGPLHKNGPLESALRDTFGDMNLDDVQKRGKSVLVTAFNLTAGRPRIFKTDHSEDLRGHGRYRLREIAMASSAAPIYLPLVELVDPISGVAERFCDGGVVSNSPALLGYAEALSSLKQNPRDVAILSIATPRTHLAEPASSLPFGKRGLNRGLVGWGDQLATLTIDGGSMVSDTALGRLAKAAGAQYCRVSLQQPAGVGLDVATAAATKTLRQIGSDEASKSTIDASIRPYFRDGGQADG